MTKEIILNEFDNSIFSTCENLVKLSKCLRRKCSAVIVKDGKIVSTGVNEPIVECNVCLRDRYNIKSGTMQEFCNAVGSHAEQNAIISALLNFIDLTSSTIYVYGHDMICYHCKALILKTKISKVIHKTEDNKVFEYNAQEFIINVCEEIEKNFIYLR